MRRDDVSWVRQMIRAYYDEVLSRADELETEIPMYDYVYFPSILFGRHHIYIYRGDELRPPAALRDEIKFIRKELKEWSTVNDEPEDEV